MENLPSHQCPPAHLWGCPPAPAHRPPPAAASAPSGPSGTCCSCTPGSRERGRWVRVWPGSPGNPCPATGTPGQPPVPFIMRWGWQNSTRQKFWGSQATRPCSPEQSFFMCLATSSCQAAGPTARPWQTSPPALHNARKRQKLRLPQNMEQMPKVQAVASRFVLSCLMEAVEDGSRPQNHGVLAGSAQPSSAATP